MYFRLIKLNFPFIKGEGKRRKLSFPSTVDNFRYTFRSPQYSFIASYDAKNELKKSVFTEFGGGTRAPFPNSGWKSSLTEDSLPVDGLI